MIWQIADHLVEIMEDRLVELYAIAERKKKLIDEKAKQIPEEQDSINTKPNTNVRTGGGSLLTNKKVGVKNEQENLNDGIVGKGLSTNSSKRPSTSSSASPISSSSSSVEKVTQSNITRPSTSSVSSSSINKSSNPSSRRLPAWAAKGLNSGNSSNSEIVSSGAGASGVGNQSHNKWANRVVNQDLQILGKPLVNKDKHKLTLELTADESTWNPNQLQQPSTSSKTTDRLASTLEEFDDVLLMDDPNNLNEELDTSDEEFITGGDVDVDADEEDRLNMTSSKLDKLEESAEKLESWLERKVSY